MYTLIGISEDGTESLLEFATLDEAMTRMRHLIEADEIDDDGPMFIRYAIEFDPPPHEPTAAQRLGLVEELDPWESPDAEGW